MVGRVTTGELKQLLYLPPFGPLCDPRLLAELAAEAEAAGWDGIFLWDHVLRRREEVIDIADPWVCLSAMAMTTSTIRLGPLVTPLTRRRPIKLAHEIVTLDHLSRGRLTMGFGLGVDTGGELTRFGEEADQRIRADRLDEGLTILDQLLVAGHCDFSGEHFQVDDVIFGPRPVQQPRPPYWFAIRNAVQRPARRAAKYEGLVPARSHCRTTWISRWFRCGGVRHRRYRPQRDRTRNGGRRRNLDHPSSTRWCHCKRCAGPDQTHRPNLTRSLRYVCAAADGAARSGRD
jgi:Luciferase-like monooxygenase